MTRENRQAGCSLSLSLRFPLMELTGRGPSPTSAESARMPLGMSAQGNDLILVRESEEGQPFLLGPKKW